ncbi:MAG: NAD(P)/FAD-dependent oxidoreductase [Calditrichaceae bacterium]|nr:NAD(P)/FAD-dependent oxidoreductase [Calditrichaceae bacterium]
MQSDVVIIGGGLGGLSAGAYLSQQGFNVTLIEEQPQVGGFAIAFNRDGFTFDVALHAIPACAPNQPFYDILSRLQIADDLKFIKLNNAFNVYLGDYNFLIPNSFSDFFQKLITEFPEEKQGLTQLKTYLEKYGRLYYDVVEGNSTPYKIFTQFIPRIPDFLKNSRLSTDDFLNNYSKNEKVKALLYQAAVFFGEPMAGFPAINFIIMFYLLFTSGMYTIHGGGQALTNALKNKMLKHKAKILTSHRIKAINIDNRLAKKVFLDDDREINCKTIIANVNTPYLIKNLIKSDSIPEMYGQLVESFKPSLSILQMHLGLNCTVEEIGVKHYLNIFFPNENIDFAMSRQNNSTMLEGYSIIAPGINYEDKKSNNRRILSIVGGVSGQEWIGLDKAIYNNLKFKITEQILNKLEILFPNLRKHIKTVNLATPHTFQRYTQNPNGAILGFKAERSKHRMLLKLNHFPIKNIFLANAWTNRLGGFMQTLKSGLIAGQKSIKYLNSLH